MKARIEVQMDNAAFEVNGDGFELARILRDLANLIEDATLKYTNDVRLLDNDGNTVGIAKFVAD